MEKAFVYGVSVENENFTDRVKEIMDTYNLGTKSNFVCQKVIYIFVNICVCIIFAESNANTLNYG